MGGDAAPSSTDDDEEDQGDVDETRDVEDEDEDDTDDAESSVEVYVDGDFEEWRCVRGGDDRCDS